MSSAKETQPNVVLILTDDQGYGDVAAHGNPDVRTPETDRLHDESARFEDFHVSPSCAPTRSALMTGRYDNRVGVWSTVYGRSLLARDETTMADMFSTAGYRTGIFGKWHLGDNYPYRPQDRGFDEALVHGGGGIAQTPDYWGNDYFDDTYFRNGEPEAFEGYCTDVWFDEALSFVEASVAADDPFFCYLPTNAPHTPLQVPEEYHQQYEGEVPEEVARFYGMLTNLDENLGRFRTRLEELGIADDTILVFLGDNGSACAHYNAGMRGSKGSMYDGGHRVPCYVHWPGEIEDQTVDSLSAGYDLLPTFVDICDLDGSHIEFDGRSLRPVLDGEPDDDFSGRTVFVDDQYHEWPEKWRDSAVLTERWRLICGEELYDIEADPGQEENVADEYPKVVERLREAYENWWDDIGPFEEYERIVGGDNVDPVDLTCHDWHESDNVLWRQPQILEGERGNGFWTLEIAESGTYEIQLRRWPIEVDAPIDGIPAEVTEMDYGSSDNPRWTATARRIDPDTARITIGDIEREKPVPSGATNVSFQVELDAGDVRLQTWLETDGDDGDPRGAYYTSLRRVSPSST